MKKCNGNYEAAMHYDCQDCDETCSFRKEEGCLTFLGSISIITLFLILYFIAFN